MSRMWRIVVVVAVAATAAACEAQCSVSSAALSEEAMTNAVDPETKAPVASVTSFAPDAPAIYATAKLSYAPDDTKVKATFHYLEGGDRQIMESEVTAEGTRYVMFLLTPPAAGWPAGQYETRLFLNGKEGKRMPFNVAGPLAPAALAPPEAPTAPQAPAAATPQRAQPATQPAAATKQFRDQRFAFTLDLPETWAYHVTASKDYLLEGPKGTDAYELSVILQFVFKSENPGATAASQLQGLVAGLEAAPNSAVTKRATGRIGGQPAPFATLRYEAKNSAGEVVPFTHTQYVVDRGAYYYLISYSGPSAIFQKYLPVFQHMLDSYRFTD